MKKISVILVLILCITQFSAYSQTPNTDFFAGKWAITFIGTPNGDALLHTNLVRKDGGLFGELFDPKGANDKIPITNIEESKDKIEIFFTASGYDVNVTLEKTDQDTLKGKLMNMFDAKATRIKEDPKQ
jgi:hypothetical protein